MKRSNVLNYAVVIGVGLVLAWFFRAEIPLPAGLALILAAALCGWLHEHEKTRLRKDTHHRVVVLVGDIKHHVNNALQAMKYADVVRPDNQEAVIEESYARIRGTLNEAAARLVDRSEDSGCNSAVASPGRPRLSVGQVKDAAGTGKRPPRSAKTARQQQRESA